MPGRRTVWQKSALDVAREYFPRMSDDRLDCILWEHTGFPFFWNIPKDGKTPEECLRKQLADLKRKMKKKR